MYREKSGKTWLKIGRERWLNARLTDLDTSLNCIYVIQVITLKTWYRVKKREPVAAGSLASFLWKEVMLWQNMTLCMYLQCWSRCCTSLTSSLEKDWITSQTMMALWLKSRNLSMLFHICHALYFYFIAEGKLRQQTSVGDMYKSPRWVSENWDETDKVYEIQCRQRCRLSPKAIFIGPKEEMLAM